MNRSISASPWGNRLDLTSPAEQQRIVNATFQLSLSHLRWLAADPRRRLPEIRVTYLVGGSQPVTPTLWEVITLRPPERLPDALAGLTTPPFLPLWDVHGTGKYVFLSTHQEWERELARTPQCYGFSLEGPWHGDAADPWPYPWKEATKGLFAPSPYGSNEPGGPQAFYTRLPLIYHGRAIFVGALFLLEDSFTDADFLSKGIVRKVEFYDYDHLVKHELTNWFFMNQRLHDDYARRSEAGDLTGIVWTVWPHQETTPTLESEDHASVRRNIGRIPESGLTYPGKEFLTILTDVIDDLWRENEGQRRPTAELIKKDSRWKDSMSRSNLYKRLAEERPDITLGDFISSRKAIALSQSV